MRFMAAWYTIRRRLDRARADARYREAERTLDFVTLGIGSE